ncbi:MAG: glycogen/starch synthase [Candidatus Kuenenbacteria bacterium]
MKKKIKVLFTAYECAPFFKMGGLGDVAGSLPKALKKLGVDIRVVLPYYREIKKRKDVEVIKKNVLVEYGKEKIKINPHTKDFGVRVNILRSYLPGSRVPIYFVDNSKWFGVKDIFDKNNRERFVLFSYLAVKLPSILKWKADVVHANDWHTGLVPILIQNRRNRAMPCSYIKIKTIYTIHNLAYLGRCALEILEKYGFNKKDFSEVDKEGMVNIMREAILSADIVNTVSPTYAKEILTKEFGAGMEKSLQKREKDLYGIVNGLDYQVFNPAIDKNIKTKYGLNHIWKKIDNKLHLQKICKLPVDKNIPIIGMISRLAGQKGFDLLEEIFDKLMQENLQLVILGTGSKHYEKYFRKMQKKYKEKFSANLKFDIKLASQIYAGADMFLMPSKYEPCGLGQLIAMKYGTVPIVRSTGGLKDTVASLQETRNKKQINSKFQIPNKFQITNYKTATGFSFEKYNSKELLKTIKQALFIFEDQKTWNKLIRNCMRQNFSWESSAKEYLKLYEKLI